MAIEQGTVSRGPSFALSRSRLLALHLLILSSITFPGWGRPAKVIAEDIVTVRNPETGQTAKRRGQIVEWKGQSLELSSGGRVRLIDNDEIVKIDTDWPASYLPALQLLTGREYQPALAKFAEALAAETRPWAKRIIRSRLVECYGALDGNHLDQAAQFLGIASDDPETRFLELIPLPWTSTVRAGDDIQQLEGLLDSKELVPQLIAASWSLGGSQRTGAIERLKALASDINPEIAALAEAQLWKTRANTTVEELKSWEDRIGKMPDSVRAGPYFILAEGLARHNQIDEAALAYMRIPILYPNQHRLVAASLYRCGGLLQNKGRAVQARSLWRELIQKYPQSFWAQQAASQLNAAPPRK